MAIVQSSYPEKIGAAVNGQIVETSDRSMDSLVCEDAAGIPVGVAVYQGAADRGCKKGHRAGSFRGVVSRDRTFRPQDAAANKSLLIPQGQPVPVMYRGDIWVEVEEAVSVGQDVTANEANGKLSSKAVSTTGGSEQTLVKGANWMTSQSQAGGLARLRLLGRVLHES